MSKKSNLAKSHDAMLAFLEKLIVNSDKFPSRQPAAQRHYDQATKLVAKAHEARGMPISSTPREAPAK